MRTIILKTATKYLLPLLLLFSVFILLRGHYLPGGGFVGGLVASIAFVLHAFAFGKDETKAFLRFHPGFFIPFGLSISLVSGFLPMLIGSPFMTGLWYPDSFPVIGMVGTPLFFDIGVFFVVIGITLTIIFTIAEAVQDMEFLLAIMIGLLYASGIYMILRRSLVKLILGLILLGNGANILIFLLGRIAKGKPPIIPEGSKVFTEIYADPVPQALILTAIVISFGLQAFAIVLIKRVYKVVGTDDLDVINNSDEEQ